MTIAQYESMNYADAIKYLRLAQDMTILDLSKSTDIGAQTLRGFESGKYLPNYDQIKILEKALLYPHKTELGKFTQERLKTVGPSYIYWIAQQMRITNIDKSIDPVMKHQRKMAICIELNWKIRGVIPWEDGEKSAE